MRFVTFMVLIVQAPALALLFPLDTFKTRLQIPFGQNRLRQLSFS